jgi:hypothetical protein
MHQYDLGAPFERIAIYVAGPYPLNDQGNRYLLIAMDYFTKWAENYSLPNQEASTVAEAPVTIFCCRFGIPWELHSEQGRNFESRLLHKIHIHRVIMLKSYHDKVGSGPASGSKNIVLNLSEYVLTDHEESVLRRGLNFTIENPIFNLDI